MCSGRAPLRAVCRAAAVPRERLRPAGWRPGGCSCRRPARSTRAGAAGAAAGPPTPCRATAPQTDHPGVVPTRATRCAATPLEPRPARARASMPMPMPRDPSAAEVVEQGLRPMTARRSRHRLPHRRREQQRGAQEGAGNGDAFPFNSGRGNGAPACPAPGACAPARLATGTAGELPVATSPEHPPAGGANPGADRCPRSPCSSA